MFQAPGAKRLFCPASMGLRLGGLTLINGHFVRPGRFPDRLSMERQKNISLLTELTGLLFGRRVL